MDPVTQGAVGAVAALCRSPGKPSLRLAFLGAAGGMAPDLDVFIRSAHDPLLALEYHRHFSHALLFIPFGALLCALPLYALLGKRWQMTFAAVYWPLLLGFASHGLLDACTSYGTQLFWPFSQFRVSFDIVSVIDPLFTLPLILFMVVAIYWRKASLVLAAVLWVGTYLGLATFQHQRALALGEHLAQSRGHLPQRLEAKPSFANILVWKVIYEHEARLYVAAVKVGFCDARVWPGSSIAKLDVAKDFPWLDPGSQQAKDIERFRWFSADYLAVYPEGSLRIADMRYSLLPDQIKPLWGIEVSPQADQHQHVEYLVSRGDGAKAWPMLWAMITADSEASN